MNSDKRDGKLPQGPAKYVPPHLRKKVMVELEREIWSSQDLEQIEIRSPPNGERSGNGRSFGDSRQTMGLDFSAFGRTSSRNTEPFRTASATSVSSASSEDGWGRRNHVGERERRWPPSTSTRGLGQRYRSGPQRWGREGREEKEVMQLFESSKIQCGINFGRYDEIPVDVKPSHEVTGTRPIESFKHGLCLASSIMDNIERAGYDTPTPVQKHALPIIAAGLDVMACAQTGSGKTAAFLLPMINIVIEKGGTHGGNGRSSFPKGLVLAPTRELVQQIYDESRKFTFKTGIVSAAVYGGSENLREQLRRMEQGADLIIATPGRLVDFLERGKVKLCDVYFLVLDEADRMLDMGFEPQIRGIVQAFDMTMSDDRQTLLFSATFPREVRSLAEDFLNKRAFVTLTVGAVGAATDTIQQTVWYSRDQDDKAKILVDLLFSQNLEGQRVLVFVATKREAGLLEELLRREGCLASSIHGDHTQTERENALKNFRAGTQNILVATDVCSRGLDVPNIMMVVNYDMPDKIEDYVHRIGRTGRVGNNGCATTFITNKDSRVCNDLVRVLVEAGQPVPDWLEDLGRNSSGGGGGGGVHRAPYGRGSRWESAGGAGFSAGDRSSGWGRSCITVGGGGGGRGIRDRWGTDRERDQAYESGWDT